MHLASRRGLSRCGLRGWASQFARGGLPGRDTHCQPALCPSGVFCNLEHVAPASVVLHRRFLEALGTAEAEEDPSNQLASAEVQLHWLPEIGFRDVDCHWKWLELALLAGVKKS